MPDNYRFVAEALYALPRGKGLTEKELVNMLTDAGMPPGDGTVRKHIISGLIKRSIPVKNTGGVGYHIDRD